MWLFDRFLVLSSPEIYKDYLSYPFIILSNILLNLLISKLALCISDVSYNPYSALQQHDTLLNEVGTISIQFRNTLKLYFTLAFVYMILILHFLPLLYFYETFALIKKDYSILINLVLLTQVYHFDVSFLRVPIHYFE